MFNFYVNDGNRPGKRTCFDVYRATEPFGPNGKARSSAISEAQAIAEGFKTLVTEPPGQPPIVILNPSINWTSPSEIADTFSDYIHVGGANFGSNFSITLFDQYGTDYDVATDLLFYGSDHVAFKIPPYSFSPNTQLTVAYRDNDTGNSASLGYSTITVISAVNAPVIYSPVSFATLSAGFGKLTLYGERFDIPGEFYLKIDDGDSYQVTALVISGSEVELDVSSVPPKNYDIFFIDSEFNEYQLTSGMPYTIVRVPSIKDISSTTVIANGSDYSNITTFWNYEAADTRYGQFDWNYLAFEVLRNGQEVGVNVPWANDNSLGISPVNNAAPGWYSIRFHAISDSPYNSFILENAFQVVPAYETPEAIEVTGSPGNQGDATYTQAGNNEFVNGVVSPGGAYPSYTSPIGTWIIFDPIGLMWAMLDASLMVIDQSTGGPSTGWSYSTATPVSPPLIPRAIAGLSCGAVGEITGLETSGSDCCNSHFYHGFGYSYGNWAETIGAAGTILHRFVTVTITQADIGGPCGGINPEVFPADAFVAAIIGDTVVASESIPTATGTYTYYIMINPVSGETYLGPVLPV